MPPKKLTLTQIVNRYSNANQTEMDIIIACATKLDPHSSAQPIAAQCLALWKQLEEYLESAGFEL